ncbi:MAG: hypothetical protein OIF36_01670 [Alphaproteobacteria bacterium]|jgi:flagellar motor component MotA|nr:hypothetical protein [Alphaproteobacteria bacterium]MCV6599178.1 hypothetical protein [Alphaproteobacteria bacterium]
MEEKNFLKSKTMIGAFVALFALILSNLFGYEISVEDKTQITEIIITSIGSAGALFAMYGRVKATKKVSLKK